MYLLITMKCRGRRQTWGILTALAAAFLLTGAGCAGPRTYTPKTLTAELTAPPVENPQLLKLSRFAGPPSNSERIDPGDVLEVSIAAGLGADDVTILPVRVGDDGTAVLPEIGQMSLAGLELGEAEWTIGTACVNRQLYRAPHVTVTVKRRRVNRITVVGAVNEPGIYELPRGSSYLLGAIVSAGGLADDAGTNVEIRRPGSPSALASAPGPDGVRLASATTGVSGTLLTRIDLAEAVRRGGVSEYLPDSSAVMIERRQPQPIQVLGLVKTPGQYELDPRQETRLLGALAMAGGISHFVADDIIVVRNDPATGDAAVINVSLAKAKRDRVENLQLAPGDLIVVERTPATLLVDMLNFVRFNVGGYVPLF